MFEKQKVVKWIIFVMFAFAPVQNSSMQLISTPVAYAAEISLSDMSVTDLMTKYDFDRETALWYKGYLTNPNSTQTIVQNIEKTRGFVNPNDFDIGNGNMNTLIYSFDFQKWISNNSDRTEADILNGVKGNRFTKNDYGSITVKSTGEKFGNNNDLTGVLEVVNSTEMYFNREKYTYVPGRLDDGTHANNHTSTRFTFIAPVDGELVIRGYVDEVAVKGLYTIVCESESLKHTEYEIYTLGKSERSNRNPLEHRAELSSLEREKCYFGIDNQQYMRYNVEAGKKYELYLPATYYSSCKSEEPFTLDMFFIQTLNFSTEPGNMSDYKQNTWYVRTANPFSSSFTQGAKAVDITEKERAELVAALTKATAMKLEVKEKSTISISVQNLNWGYERWEGSLTLGVLDANFNRVNTGLGAKKNTDAPAIYTFTLDKGIYYLGFANGGNTVDVSFKYSVTPVASKPSTSTETKSFTEYKPTVNKKVTIAGSTKVKGKCLPNETAYVTVTSGSLKTTYKDSKTPEGKYSVKLKTPLKKGDVVRVWHYRATTKTYSMIRKYTVK